MRRDRDAFLLLLKKNGEYFDADVLSDLERGKFRLHLKRDDGGREETLCIEAPRLRSLVRKYDEALKKSGLPKMTDDGYGR